MDLVSTITLSITLSNFYKMKLRLIYPDVPFWRVETSRIALFYGGIEFEDIRLSRGEISKTTIDLKNLSNCHKWFQKAFNTTNFLWHLSKNILKFLFLSYTTRIFFSRKSSKNFELFEYFFCERFFWCFLFFPRSFAPECYSSWMYFNYISLNGCNLQ